MDERLLKVGLGNLGFGEERPWNGEEQARVGGRLVARDVLQPPEESVHRVAETSGAVLLQVLQGVHGDATFVREVNVRRSTSEGAGDVCQAALLQLEGEHGGVFGHFMFFDEPGDVDVVPRVLLSVGVQPHQQPCRVGAALDRLAPPFSAPPPVVVVSNWTGTREGFDGLLAPGPWSLP
ncbi:hypothetical protein [Streptomyces sp. NPDC058545]|uniref:hypothetical protein n=1 Tax=Streptomyces sp. NPDC058545 TaxID=3346544 RepID=UPI00364C5408